LLSCKLSVSPSPCSLSFVILIFFWLSKSPIASNQSEFFHKCFPLHDLNVRPPPRDGFTPPMTQFEEICKIFVPLFFFFRYSFVVGVEFLAGTVPYSEFPPTYSPPWRSSRSDNLTTIILITAWLASRPSSQTPLRYLTRSTVPPFKLHSLSLATLPPKSNHRPPHSRGVMTRFFSPEIVATVFPLPELPFAPFPDHFDFS